VGTNKKSCYNLTVIQPTGETTMLGETFGQLTVVAAAAPQGNKKLWVVQCACGSAKRNVYQYNLTSGKSKSCGCTRGEAAAKAVRTHGASRTPEHMVWGTLIQRCTNPNSRKYKSYGGRGLTVCDEWKEFSNFIRDMGPRPSPKHSIDRIDNNKGYFPSNCRWATCEQQAGNTRRNIIISHGGETLCLSAWCRKLGLVYETVKSRIRRGVDPLTAMNLTCLDD
jgi:hypothetical protein